MPWTSNTEDIERWRREQAQQLMDLRRSNMISETEFHEGLRNLGFSGYLDDLVERDNPPVQEPEEPTISESYERPELDSEELHVAYTISKHQLRNLKPELVELMLEKLEQIYTSDNPVEVKDFN